MMPAVVVLVNANCFPSCDQRNPPARAPGGSARGILVPSGTFTSVIDVL